MVISLYIYIYDGDQGGGGGQGRGLLHFLLEIYGHAKNEKKEGEIGVVVLLRSIPRGELS